MGGDTTVLVVGDETLVDRLDALPASVTVTAAETTADGLAHVDRPEADVDCLVTDHDPPALDCLSLLDALPATVPVVVAVTDGSATLASDALGAGAADFVALDGDTSLADRVADVLDDRATSTAELERYRTIVEALGDPVYALDEDARLTFVNSAVLEVTGYDADELLGEHVETVVDEAHETAAADLIARLLDADDPRRATVEGCLLTSDGEEIPVENSLALLPAEDGQFRGTAGIVRDITDRKRRIEDLEQYETIVEAVPDGVFVLDEDVQIIGGNDRGAEMLGYEKADLLGTSIPTLVDRGVMGESVIEGYTDLLPRLLSDGSDRETGRFEFTVHPADSDEERIFEARIALRPYDETYRGSIGILRDITDRKRRIEELERYETIIEAVPDTVYAVDEDGYFTFVNESAAEQFGYDPAQVDAGEVSFEDTVADEDVAEIREEAQALLSDDDERRKATVEYTAVTSDGRRYPAENHFAVIDPQEGTAGAGISRDISQRKRRKRRLDVLNRVLRHNLRNDIAGIIALAQAIESESDDPSVRSEAADIRDLGNDLADMADRSRKLATATGGEPLDEQVDAVDCIERALTAVSAEYAAADISVDLPDSVPVVASPLLETAVAELLENAIEHNDSDQPRVEVSLGASDEREDGWVDITVADNGPGIPVAEQEVITTEEITPLKHGSGLGLWTVVWLVEAFHGDVDIQSREPRGTVVTLRLKQAAG